MKNHVKLPKEAVIPEVVSRITFILENAGFEAYLVGGCVRDLLLDQAPKDWDITTNATPDQITALFEHSHYDNDYGTVRVVNDDVPIETLKVVEVTTYRLEAEYSDGRRPDNVIFSTNIEDDLKRRDFTVNALALKIPQATSSIVTRENLTDLYGGLEDLDQKILKTVGDPEERFNEDALRIMRAVRLSVQLGFEIQQGTLEALKTSAHKLKNIALERIREEFEKMIMSKNPMRALELSRETNIVRYIAPELEEGIGIDQNQAHAYTVWEHLIRSLQLTADKDWPLEIRLAALFHDIAKPATRRFDETKKDVTFYGHEVVGARMTRIIMERLKFPKKITEKVVKLVRWHMFFSDPETITLSAVRRLVRNVGEENVWDLMNIRVADRVGTGRPKEEPYRLRKYYSMIEEALRAPVSVGMLKIDGTKVIEVTRETPGPRIGYMLHALLEEVLDDPSKNTEVYLENRSIELSKLSTDELRGLGEKGREKKQEEEEKELKEIRGKYHVK